MKAANWAALGLMCGLAMGTAPALAQEHQTLGWGSIFNNDFLGDGEDRWLTDSYTVSMVRGTGWGGGAPEGFGDVVEYRFRTQIYTPESLTAPAAPPADRRYAGILSFGAHSHFSRGLLDYTVGGDLVVIGPQTGVSNFQEWTHEILDADDPSVAAANQLENAIYPTALVSATMPVSLGAHVEMRPFAEAQAGVETFVRVGSDLIFGGFDGGNLLIRDHATGHLYAGTHDGTTGTSFLLGGDIAYVSHSNLLPTSDGYSLTDHRSRLRAGINWQGEKLGLFYGVTWLSEEFTTQRTDQVLGTVNVRLKF